MSDNFNLFLESVDEQNRDFVAELNDFLLQNHCRYDIKSAKSGYVVSYILCDRKKTLATFVFRKSGIRLRIYADHVAEYQELLERLPEKMKKDIRKASVCKRLVDPEDCNPKCPRGYSFSLDGEAYQKCRHMAFMPALNKENNPFIRELLEKELITHRGAQR